MDEHYLEALERVKHGVEALVYCHKLADQMSHFHQLAVLLLARVEYGPDLDRSGRRVSYLDISLPIMEFSDADVAFVFKRSDVLLLAHHRLVQPTNVQRPCGLIAEVNARGYGHYLKNLELVRRDLHFELHVFA